MADDDQGKQANSATDSKKTPEEPKPLTQSDLDSFKAGFEKSVSELSATVGRAQSTAEKAAQREPDAELQARLDAQSKLLSQLATGLSADALSDDLRLRVQEAAQMSAVESERKKFKAEILAAVNEDKTPADDAPPDPAANAAAAATERGLRAQIAAAGLDSNDKATFDFAKYGGYYQNGDVDGMYKSLADDIVAAQEADKADDRRDERNDNAGSSPQGGATTPSGDLSAQLEAKEGDLDAQIAALNAAIGR